MNINNIDSIITEKIVAVHRLINYGWLYMYDDFWSHPCYSKTYVESLSDFEKSLSHLYTDNKSQIKRFSTKEALKAMKVRNEGYQLSFDFGD